MPPTAVRDVIRRAWKANAAVLSRVYAAVGPPGLRAAALRLRKKSSGKALADARARWLDAYQMFFLDVVLVPPNRARPPSQMGDQMYEHAQNIALQEVRGCGRPDV